MPQVAVYNTLGDKVGEMTLSETQFNAEISEPSLHQAVVAYLAAQRQGTHSTRIRSEVRGGGRKPWRLKGTVRARVGSIRSPLWRGGGVTFGPKPRDYRIKMHKNVKRVAIRSAFSSNVQDEDLIVLESLELDAPKTKEMVAL